MVCIMVFSTNFLYNMRFKYGIHNTYFNFHLNNLIHGTCTAPWWQFKYKMIYIIKGNFKLAVSITIRTHECDYEQIQSNAKECYFNG